jgi:hypothetical protein
MIVPKQDLKIHCGFSVVKTAKIELFQRKCDCVLRFLFDENTAIDFVNYDFFECLTDLRIYLENKNCFPLCNGARMDICCGGMLREATNGCWGYIVSSNESIVQDEEEVYIFDYADLSLISTVDKCRNNLSKNKTPKE